MDQNNKSSKVTFADDELQRSVQSFQAQSPKMIQWIIKYSGGNINEKQANYILIGFSILVFIISLFLLFGGNVGKKISPMTPEQKSYMETGHGL
ncbi:MAG: hypothetical protein WCW87_02500 [Candidatus Paceibacterota bacterium]